MNKTAAAVAATAFALAGCAPMVTQSPGQGLSPVNAISQGEDKHLMLAGHDVVSYFTQNRHAAGQLGIKSVHKDVTFHFANPEHKALFDAAPEKYLPQFGGYCANGIVYGIPWGGDADRFKLIEGKLYIFGGQGSLDAWNLDEPRNLQLARKYWQEEVQGSNSFIQRTRRLMFKVPHYKSGEELAKMVAEAKAKK